MEGKIIAVWGSPHSGKTTFATKLATAIYSSFESTVITLYTDLQTPMIPVLFPFDKPEDLGSVGYPLSRTDVEQSDIINNLVTIKEMQNFGFLGYRTGENRYTYPKFGKAKAEDLLNALCKLADYVIVDCTSDLEGNTLAQTAIEKADQIIRLSSPDLSSLSFRFIPTADSAWKTTFRGLTLRMPMYICRLRKPKRSSEKSPSRFRSAPLSRNSFSKASSM